MRRLIQYISDSLTYEVDPLSGEEGTRLVTDMRATYLLTVVTENPMETIWLYQVVLNGYLQSQQRFALWGLHGTSIRGMDVHPDLAYLPEQVYGDATSSSPVRGPWWRWTTGRRNALRRSGRSRCRTTRSLIPKETRPYERDGRTTTGAPLRSSFRARA